MSYCRWSSMNFGCDLYVYGDTSGGWTIHVAANRIIGKVPAVVWPVDQSPEALDRFAASLKFQHEFVKSAAREPIELPHAGESFHLRSPQECADQVERLAALGYRVPPGLVPALRGEDLNA